jgi:hypothetical protein
MGASYRTTNFVVHAPTPEIAQQFGQWAEHYRRQKAIEWLGHEMPPWSEPCPLQITIDMSGPSGATSFNFGQDQQGRGVVMGQYMQIRGSLERLRESVLPHEITHTVFAYYFRCPVPRWADEGGSVLSEDDIERIRHDKLVRQILNSGQEIRLRTLLPLKEYPRGKVMHLYAEGYSLTDYLVNRSDKRTFLNFIAYGMRYGWDQAAWAYYKHRTVDELEEAWLKHLRDTKGQNHIEVARQRQTQGQMVAQNKQPANQNTVVRLTVPPETPAYQPSPVVRAQNPENDERRGSGIAPGVTPATPTGRPNFLPDYQQPANPGWQMPAPARQPQSYAPVPVGLGTPQFSPFPANPGPAAPGMVSPVGFPQ